MKIPAFDQDEILEILGGKCFDKKYGWMLLG